MRIGIVTGEYPPMQGGVGAYSQLLAQTLVSQGHYVFIFSANQAKSCDLRIKVTSSGTGWRLSNLRAIKRWARDKQIEVLNLQFQTAAFGMSPWIHFLPHFVRDVPFVTTFHDLRFPYLFPKAGRLRDWFVMHLAHRSDGVIVTNHEDYARVSRLLNAQLIPIGSNILTSLPSDFDPLPWRNNAGANVDDFLLAHFGFMNRSKDIEILLETLAMLRDDGLPVKLIMIGGRTGSSDADNIDYAKMIDKKIEDLGLVSDIYWTGYIDDRAISAYLTAADLVILPFRDGASFRRGSLMAAIHQGCAILTTTPQVEIEMFANGENMVFFPPGDPTRLTETIRRLYHAPDQRERLRDGATSLRGCFDWGQIAYDYAAFFQQVTRYNN